MRKFDVLVKKTNFLSQGIKPSQNSALRADQQKEEELLKEMVHKMHMRKMSVPEFA